MAIDLERKVKAADKSGHATCMPLLGSCMVCFACLHHVHLERSVPTIYPTANTVQSIIGLSLGYAGSIFVWMALGHVLGTRVCGVSCPPLIVTLRACALIT